MRKKLKPRVRRLLWVVLGAMLAVIAAGGWWFYGEYTYRFSPQVLRSGSFYVRPGQSFAEAMRALDGEGFVASAEHTQRQAERRGLDTVHVGHYRLEKGMSARTLLSTLAGGRQTPVHVTFNNIRTLNQLAGRVGRVLLADSAALAAHFRAEAASSGEGPNYIGRFLPDTYEFYWTATPDEFTAAMQEYRNRFWDRSDRTAKAKKLGLTPEQATVVASIVIEETKRSDEMTAVAGVYVNRLAKGMPLQADPTVKFAVGDFSLRRILNKHTQVDSPYNTYKYSGLPPGPICAPAASVIDAVLAYGDVRHGWLYFCASPAFDGSHSFAATLAEHNRNAALYHKALNKRGIK